ncbi:DUF2075 domain-containing protein [Corynebacterium jeikeium]|uniref:DUF2075 domain-containing protein n=2 Tax=Corynebacterium macclintockiae TaxID=2913501 RepID=UPI00068C722A
MENAELRKQADTQAIHQQIAFNEAGVQSLKIRREENDRLAAFRDRTIKTDDDLLYNFPVVYVIKNEEKNQTKPYTAYVGETTDIIQRTTSHLKNTRKDDADWTKLKDSKNSQLIILGHELFNKSLTLDVENRLMLMLSSVEAVKKLENRRSNDQLDYYTKERFDEVFHEIWAQLQTIDANLFPELEKVYDSALYKASPFHSLTEEQVAAKRDIMEVLYEKIHAGSQGNLVMVEGEAGAGKTVLLSSLFYDIMQNPVTTKSGEERRLDCYLVVNHDEQVNVYTQIAEKLGLHSKSNERVLKPTRFIDRHSTNEKVDLVLIDEAHLLWTQGKQSYRGDNQLLDIISRAKVTVAVYDKQQVLQANQWWEKEPHEFVAADKYSKVPLRKQMRMAASQGTLDWLNSFLKEHRITNLDLDTSHRDAEGYHVEFFADVNDMRNAIKHKASDTDRGLSRMVATYDWPYNASRKPENGDSWGVSIGDFFMPWNREITVDAATKRKKLAWAEQPQTINEVGSVYTVQGFDLNYAGVIIGPSVKLENGQIRISPDKSFFRAATNKRTLSYGSGKGDFSDELLWNQLYVLMTRGVHGLFVYACDEELRNALIQAQKFHA